MKYLRTMDHHKYIFLRATLNRVRILLRRNFLLWETMLWVSFFEFRISLEWIWIDLNCLIDEDVEVDGVYEGSRKKKGWRIEGEKEEENGATGDQNDADWSKLKRNCMISRAVGDRRGRLAVRIQIDVRRKKFCLFYTYVDGMILDCHDLVLFTVDLKKNPWCSTIWYVKNICDISITDSESGDSAESDYRH